MKKMKLLLTYTLVVLAKNFIVCQNVKENVVICREKFTEKTYRDYNNYNGCLIEKNKTIIQHR